jgi:RNA polymerase sigma-70 factor (ECF subfamily)
LGDLVVGGRRDQLAGVRALETISSAVVRIALTIGLMTRYQLHKMTVDDRNRLVPTADCFGMDHLTRLLLDAQRGDRDALERFIAATQHDVVTMCRYLGDRDNAEDLAQEAYRRAFTSLHRFRATGPAKHWLLTITRRTCADATRRRIRRRRVEQRILNFARDERDDSVPVGDRISVDELLHELDTDRRDAFVLTQLNGMRYEEAAELLDVPIGTIRSRVSRAREQLLESLRAAERSADREPEDRRRRPHL